MDRVDPNQFVVFATSRAVNRRAEAIAKSLNKKYQGKKVTAVISLNGGACFAWKVINCLSAINPDIDLRITYVQVNSYKGNKSGEAKVIIGLKPEDVVGRYVVLMEDIVDSGKTIKHLMDMVRACRKGAEKVLGITFVTMVNKPHTHKKLRYKIDFIVGFVYNGNDFLIGVGLDFNGDYRNLQDIRIMPNPEELPLAA